jgi:hypothetical protein
LDAQWRRDRTAFAQHAIIENVGGKTVIASWEPSPIDLNRLMVVFQSKESFLLRYSNRSVWFDVPNKRGGGGHSESVALGPWWLIAARANH